MSFPFSCLICIQLFFRSSTPFLPAKRFIRLTGKSSYDMSDASCNRICLKYSHCHHRNHFYNPHIQSHYPGSSPQRQICLNLPHLDVTLMTETEFVHLQRRLFVTPFCLFFFVRSPRNMHARVSRAMARFFLKIAHLSFSMGPAPGLKMVFSYGLRPRLWLLLLAIQDPPSAQR